MTTPDHAENTGDNLRHAAEVQQEAQEGAVDTTEQPELAEPVKPLPDFNT